MIEKSLSRVQAWQLENTLFKLYKTIQSCIDSIGDTGLGLFSTFDTIGWIDKDTVITDYFEKPQTYEYGSDPTVNISEHTLHQLRDFIIENEDIGLAIDLTEQELNLHSFILFLETINEELGGCFSSIKYITMLRDFRYEVFKWASFYLNRQGTTVEEESQKKLELSYLLSQNLSGNHLKMTHNRKQTFTFEEDGYSDDTFDIGDYFKPDYDKKKLLKIYKHISVLAYEQEDLYISKIISIIAYAHYNKLLVVSFSKTITAVLTKFHIEVKPNYKHPATFGQPTIKGRHREAYIEAIEFFKTL